MRLEFPQFWKKKVNIISILFYPFTFVYFFLNFIKNQIDKLNYKEIDIKTVCCGNIILGGTGKTPLTIKIYSELSKQKKCCTVKKNRLEHIDEINFLKKYSKVFCEKNRTESLIKAKKNNYKIAILDDGSQDYSIKKNVQILCIKSKIGFANEFLLPSGPLRENLRNIKYYNYAVINGLKNKKIENTLKKYNNKIKIFYSKYIIKKINLYKNKNYFAFSGIADNNDFFDLLKKNKIKIIKTKSFPDHYNYSKLDIKNIFNLSKKNKLKILTTEKDYYRLPKNLQKQIEYISLDLKIKNINMLIKSIKNEII